MALSYFNEPYMFGKEFTLLPYRWKKLNDKSCLVTTDSGSWVLLSDREFLDFSKEKIDERLFKLLDEKGIILTRHNMSRINDAYTRRFSFLKDGTSLHIIIPTLRCNQKCVYCHSSAEHANKKDCDMDFETADKTLYYIFQTPSQKITIEFQGGDSLLHFDLFKHVVSKAKEMNLLYKKKIRFALVTNLTLMTDDFLDFILKEGVSICTSLDGPKEVHDKNRKLENGAPTYDKVVYWIEKIKKEHKITVGALMVTTHYSLSRPKEIIDEYVTRGISEIQIKYINRLGFAQKQWDEIGYTTEEFLNFWKKCVDYMIFLNKKGVHIKERYVCFVLKKILSHEPSFLDFRSPCGIVCGQQAYNFNGDIYACDEARNFELFKLGTVFDNSYKEVVSSEKSRQLISSSINDNYLCDACAYKPWCGICPVISYAEQGNIIPKLSSYSKCKYHKFIFDYVFTKLLFDKEAREIFIEWFNDWKKLE